MRWSIIYGANTGNGINQIEFAQRLYLWKRIIFSEYERKKRKSFSGSVQKAVDQLKAWQEVPSWKCRKRGKSRSAPDSPTEDRQEQEQEESFSSDNENYVSYPVHSSFFLPILSYLALLKEFPVHRVRQWMLGHS